MATTFLTPADSEAVSPGMHGINRPLPSAARWGFVALLIGGLAYAGWSNLDDTQQVGEQLAIGSFLFLALALVPWAVPLALFWWSGRACSISSA